MLSLARLCFKLYQIQCQAQIDIILFSGFRKPSGCFWALKIRDFLEN